MIRLLDLHADELAMLKRLDDGITADDRIGIAADRLTVPELRAWEKLWLDGFADYAEGWQGKIWLLLTDRGRELKRTGKVGR